MKCDICTREKSQNGTCMFCSRNVDKKQVDFLIKYIETLEKDIGLYKTQILLAKVEHEKLKVNKSKYNFYRRKIELYETGVVNGIDNLTDNILFSNEILIHENKKLVDMIENDITENVLNFWHTDDTLYK